VNSRLFDRLAAAASIMILVGLGMLSYFLAQQAERLTRPSAPRAIAHEPDYFVERLRLLKANAAGDPALRMEAALMRHYPDDRTIEFDEPHVVTLADDRPAIRVTARTGRSPDTGEKTELIGNVRIVRDETPDAPSLVVLTSAATVLFDEKVIWSDAPVRMATC
jgi:lipopolysaccharide export system protein LptC